MDGWGNAAEWAGALFGGGALIVAVQTVRMELQHRHRDEERQRAAQARRIVVHLKQEVDPSGTNAYGVPVAPPWRRSATLTVTNRSDAPIYRVVGTTNVPGVGVVTLDAPVVEPGADLTENADAPGVINDPGDDGPARVRVVFTDAQGVTWVAGSSGQLEELENE